MIKKYFNEHKGAVATPWFSKNGEFITGIRYDKSQGLLYVRIGKVYKYVVPISLADEFSKSSNWGKFYNEHIKGKKSTKGKISKRVQPSVETPHDSAVKDVIGYAWGTTELALAYIPMPLYVRVPVMITEGIIDYTLGKQGIETPKVFDYIENTLIARNLFMGLKGPSTKAAGFARTLRTKYFTAGYKAGATPLGTYKGVGKVKITPQQVARGMVAGSSAWKRAIVKLDIRARIKAMTPDVFLETEEIEMIKNFAKYGGPGYKPSGTEKALDWIIKNEKTLPYYISGAYLTYAGIKTYRKEPEEKSLKTSVAETSFEVTKTVFEVPIEAGKTILKKSIKRIF